MRTRTVIAAGIAAVLLVALWMRPAADPVRVEEPRAGKGRNREIERPVAKIRPPAVPESKEVPLEEAAAPASAPPVPVVKEPRVVVSGRVVGPGDQPIAGAAVALFRGEEVATSPEGTLAEILSDRVRVPRPSLVAVTEEDGAFRFEISPAPLASLLAEKEGWTPARVERVSFRADAEGIVLRLTGPAPVAGTVLRMEGGRWVGAVGATVMLCGSSASDGGEGIPVRARSETGEDGTFSLVGAVPGTADLVVLLKEMKPAHQSFVDVPSVNRVVRMEPAVLRFLRGVVLLPDGMKAAPDVKVTVRTRPAGRPAEALQSMLTDANGRFAFDGVEWSVACPLHAEFEGGRHGYALLSRSPWPGDSDEQVTLEAPPEETLRGVALEEKPDGTRLPVAGLKLRASFDWDTRAGKLPREVFDTTAADGSFEFKGVLDREVAVNPVDPAATWAVNVPNLGLVPWKPAAGPWEVEILLVPNLRGARFGEVTVAGHVVGADGAPLPGARVWGFGPPCYADREGRFLLRGLVPMSGPKVGMMVTIRASADGFQPTRGEDIYLIAGSDPTGMVIPFTGVLLPVRGRIVDDEGRPLSGARVAFNRFTSWTGPDGWWRAEGIPGSVSKVTITLKGFRPAVIDEVQAGDPVETVVLARE